MCGLTRRHPPFAALLALAALAAGCAHGSASSASTSAGSSPSTQPGPAPTGAGVGRIEGRVYTTECTRKGDAPCPPQAFRGSLVFCHRMTSTGPCPAARVDGAGNYRIDLPAGRYALIGAPSRGNVVFVLWRWVQIAEGQVTTVNVHGGNLNR